ncbi:MAG: IPT/TIG domain-containing protein [Phaeodactylibacter sp.]|nr:IPT/TIG domain-containing protein [Phaeodactylibacter sp.]
MRKKESPETQNSALPIVMDGGILAPQALASLDDLLEMYREKFPSRCLTVTFEELLPPIACADGLMDQAWKVLKGSPAAAAYFRSLLNAYPGSRPGSPDWKRAAAIISTASGNNNPKSNGADHPLLPRERMIPVAMATIYSSRNLREMTSLLGGLLYGLSGIDALARLFNTGMSNAEEFDITRFVSAFDIAARQAISLPWPDGRSIPIPDPGEIPDFGDFPLPGIPGIPGFPFPREIPEPEVPDFPRLIDGFEACLQEMIPHMHNHGTSIFSGTGTRYGVDSVSPEHACSGDIVTIEGTGFSGTREIFFTGEPNGVSPRSVSDTEITVEVPPRAVTGPVWPNIPERVKTCDGRYVSVARRGRRGTFISGRASITRFELTRGRDCFFQGEPATLYWAVGPENVSVAIRMKYEDEAAETLYSGTARFGTLSMEAFSRTGNYRLTIRVANENGSCESSSRTIRFSAVPRPVHLSILGVELTQGIQRFTLGHPDPLHNNSIALVANKPTILRVYVRAVSEDEEAARITGYLNFRRHRIAPINGDPAGSSPFIVGKPSPNRREINDTLNFLIPEALSHGDGEAYIEVFPEFFCPGISPVSVSYRQRLSWRHRPPLPITIRRIADPHTGDVVTPGEALRIVVEAFDRLPSPASEVRIRPGVFSIPPFSAEANYCREGGFYQLALSVAYEHNSVEGVWPDPHESIWIGLFFQWGCNASGMMSWPWTSTCISQRAAVTAAHEIAHCVGMGHTKTTAGEDCDNLFQPVACLHIENNPDIEEDNGQVLDVVYDIRNNLIPDPDDVWDLMSYHSGFLFPHPDHWEGIRIRMDDRF